MHRGLACETWTGFWRHDRTSEFFVPETLESGETAVKEKYDVIVAGAGPAGLLAAKALAQNGYSVAVIERKSDMKEVTRACGQSLLPPNEYFFGDLFHYNARDRRFCFPLMGLSFPYTGPVKSLHAWHMFSPGMNSMQFGGARRRPLPCLMTRRSCLPACWMR